jgi:hypothetical protein
MAHEAQVTLGTEGEQDILPGAVEEELSGSLTLGTSEMKM